MMLINHKSNCLTKVKEIFRIQEAKLELVDGIIRFFAAVDAPLKKILYLPINYRKVDQVQIYKRGEKILNMIKILSLASLLILAGCSDEEKMLKKEPTKQVNAVVE